MLAMMLLTIVGGLFFMNVNLSRGLVKLALIEGLCVVYALALMPVIYRTHRLRPWALAFLIPWSALVLSVLLVPSASSSVVVWPLLLPLILHFVLGRHLGLPLSLAALAAAGGIATWRYGLPSSREELVYAGNLVVAGLSILILAYVYDRARDMAESELNRLATTDPLTQLPNRGMLVETFTRLRAISLRAESPLSMLMLDIDHFKCINDQHGHAAGDAVLEAFARFLRQQLRETDFVFRLGGEEFMVVLAGADHGAAAAVAETIRCELENLRVPFGSERLTLTASIGVATLGTDGETLDDLLRISDRRMYQAKTQGRNRVEAGTTAPPGKRTDRPE